MASDHDVQSDEALPLASVLYCTRRRTGLRQASRHLGEAKNGILLRILPSNTMTTKRQTGLRVGATTELDNSRQWPEWGAEALRPPDAAVQL